MLHPQSTPLALLTAALLVLVGIEAVLTSGQKVGYGYGYGGGGDPRHFLQRRRPPSSALSPSASPSACPPDFKTHPLILISMDGFRANYLERGLTPTIQSLAAQGVRAPYMKPSYPTITFPNHYTLVTGMYPPAHGIVSNKFYDPEFDAEFRLGQPEMFQKRFWGGQPVWMTAELQGKRAATYFWPGSETEGNRPTYWYKYNESIPFHTRVDQVLSWLDLPAGERPDFLTLYMHEPDRAGHNFGPDSPQVSKKLQEVDAAVGRLVEGLKARRVLGCVNLLVVSDHGMAEAGQSRAINLHEYVPNIANRTRFWDGIFGRFTPNDGSQRTKQAMMEALSCKRKEMRVYEKSTLPIRWHVAEGQRRVEEVVLDLDAGYSVGADHTFTADAGDHGYDNYFPDMNSLFLAHGPAFRRNFEVEAFQNIELYNLMCLLLGVTPAPNNGTWGALHHFLATPPPMPYAPPLEYPPAVAAVPDEDYLKYVSLVRDCPGDVAGGKDLTDVLEEAQEEAPIFLQKHLPWGLPQMGPAKDSTLLLMQPDFVTGYSLRLRLPLWTSYTLTQGHRRRVHHPWLSDVRLKAQERTPCQAYGELTPLGILPQPLFPPQFTSRTECGHLAYLVSNALPASAFLRQRWGHLEGLVNHWTNRYGTVSVVTGPVFDYNSDTYADDLEKLTWRNSVPVPTHLFLVVTRCLKWVSDLGKCPPSHLDALAFVYPQYLAVSNCLDNDRFAQEFSAKVQDVEKITGLRLFPQLSYQDQVRLQVRMHSNIWGKESWENRLWYNQIWSRK